MKTSKLLLRFSLILCEFIAGIAGNLVAGWIQDDLWHNFYNPVRLAGTLMGVLGVFLIYLFLIDILERNSAHDSADSTNKTFNTIDISQGIPESFDVFISYTKEDASIAHSIEARLRDAKLKVWSKENSISLGSSVRNSIDEGLLKSSFGVVIISKALFKDDLSVKELNGLFQRELVGRKIILPVWHNITLQEILAISPILADKYALSTSNSSVERIVNSIVQTVNVQRDRETVQDINNQNFL